MPRIEYIPDDFDESTGDGSPTIDVCRVCKRDFVPGERIEETIFTDFMGVIGSVEVEHPPYEECDYECESCGGQLSEIDD